MKKLILTFVAVIALGSFSSCSFEEMVQSQKEEQTIVVNRNSGANAIDTKIKKND